MSAGTTPRVGDLVLLLAGSVRGLHIVIAAGPDAVAVTSAAELRVEGGSFRVEMSDILAVWRASSADLSRLPSREHPIDLTPKPAPVAVDVAPLEAPDDPSVVIVLPDPKQKAVEIVRFPPRGHGAARTIHYDATAGRILVDRRDVNAILHGIEKSKLGPGESSAGFDIPPVTFGF
jgi:hypothetical protein